MEEPRVGHLFELCLDCVCRIMRQAEAGRTFDRFTVLISLVTPRPTALSFFSHHVTSTRGNTINQFNTLVYLLEVAFAESLYLHAERPLLLPL